MKIGLLTYHFGYNEGTMLQAYASLKLLEQHFIGHAVEIFDWRFSPKEDQLFASPKNPREVGIHRFFEEKLIKSADIVRSIKPYPAYQYANENYDVIVIGSDEVWRLGYRKGFPFIAIGRQVMNPWVPKFPNPYWPLPTQINKPVFSLSSSVSDNDSVNNITAIHRRMMRKTLLRIRPLSVRDKRTENFVTDIIGDENHSCMTWMPDPTFSLSLTHAEESKTFKEIRRRIDQCRPKSIALLVSVHEDPRVAELINILKSRNFHIVSVSENHSQAEEDFSDLAIDPLDWARLPSLVDLVITERFHGAVFSLKNNTPLIALGYRKQRSDNPSKLLDLLSRFEMKNRFVDMVTIGNNFIPVVENLIMHEKWAGDNVDQICKNFASRLHVFIKEVSHELQT